MSHVNIYEVLKIESKRPIGGGEILHNDFMSAIKFQMEEIANTRFLPYKSEAIVYFERGARYSIVDLSDTNREKTFTKLGNEKPLLWHSRIGDSIQIG